MIYLFTRKGLSFRCPSGLWRSDERASGFWAYFLRFASKSQGFGREGTIELVPYTWTFLSLRSAECRVLSCCL